MNVALRTWNQQAGIKIRFYLAFGKLIEYYFRQAPVKKTNPGKHFMRKFAYAILASLTLLCCSGRESVEITRLTCEYLTNPLGIDVARPRLSWIMESNENGQKQTAYRILAASSKKKLQAGQGDLWDTGKVVSDQSIHVVYDGSPLSSRQQVFWKVRVWDAKNRPSEWSETAFWEMGLLQQQDWQAAWIGSPAESDSFSAAPLFRKEFTINEPVKRARLYVTGLGYYEACLNGSKIGDYKLSPNQTNYDRRQVNSWPEQRVGNMKTRVLYQSHDITGLLHSGENTLGMWLGAGWYRQNDRLDDRPLWYDSPRLIAQLEIEYLDGRRKVIVSDENWKTAAGPILYNGLHTGEIYDARLEQPGWDRPGFDDSHWQHAVRVRPPEGQLRAQMSPPDRVIKTLKPARVETINDSTYRYDLGQMISGWTQLRLAGPAGARLTLKFQEELGPTYGQTDTFILKGAGEETWEPRFTWHAFRYVDVSGSPRPMTPDNLAGRVVNTNVDTAGWFECSNPLFNRILQNYRWTQLGNMHGGIPSDCPHRERRGYTGDGQISCRAAMFNFDMAAFYTKWMNDIADAQNGLTGYVPNTAPYQDGGGGTAWGSAIVIIPWNMFLFYGDKNILASHYGGMKKWIGYLEGELNSRGLLENQGLGEWVPPEPVELPAAFVNTSYFYYNCDLMERIASILGRDEESKEYSELKKSLVSSLLENYYHPELSAYSTGTQGANAFPLGFAYAPDSLTHGLLDQLVRHIETTCQGHFDTGILATPLQLDVLSDNGAHEWAYTLMDQQDYPGFGHMINQGATTIWETWGGDASHSHPMFGSVCQWFYEKLAGINPDPKAPGFKHIIFRPMPVADLTFARAAYKSPYGTIKSEWKIDGSDFVFDVTVPVNCTATVLVPAISRESITTKGNGSDRLIQFKGMNKGLASYSVASGRYRFESKNCIHLFPKPAIPAPVITPSDTVILKPDSVLITIKTAVPGGDIYYSLDGSEPVKRYETPFYLSSPAQIKARVLKKGRKPGFIKTRTIRFVDPDRNGLQYRYYPGQWVKVPNMDNLTPRHKDRVYRFGLEGLYLPDELFALRFTGKIKIEKQGKYTFWTSTNDGSLLYINGRLVVSNDGLHGPQERSGSIFLSPGKHDIRLDYFQAGGGLFLKVWYQPPDGNRMEIPAEVLFQ